jgi:hypothetical protein
MNRRYWRKRKDIPKKKPDTSKKALKDLSNAVSAYYRKEGRGRHCETDHYLRSGRFHYFFAYPQDYTDTFIGYDEGKFVRCPQNPAFEVVFIFDPHDGDLDLFVRGDKNVVKDLQTIFGRTILHEELGEEDRKSVPYDLSKMKKANFPFPTDPADRVVDVRVKELKFSIIGDGKKKIVFDAGPKGSKEDVYEFIKESLHEQRLPLSMVNVGSVVIQMTFENTNGAKRPTKKLTFRVSYPNSCNLKDSPEELIAKKYLKEWKIERQ